MVVIQSTTRKHLGVMLDIKLDFQVHLKDKRRKINKTVVLLTKLKKILIRPSLRTIYKLFVKPHLGYGKIIYNEAYNTSFHQKQEKIQYNSATAIAVALKGTFKKKNLRRVRIIIFQKKGDGIKNSVI